MRGKKGIYFASALFSGRETSFNLDIAIRLESLGYNVDLPQREGFEFSNLDRILRSELPEEEVDSATQTIIYLLDMGILLPRNNVVLANFDEPLDEGVVTEVAYGKLMHKLVIGYRTDTRSPYGNLSNRFGGMHFFPAYQTDFFIKTSMTSKTKSEEEDQKNKLVDKIDDIIQKKLGLKHVPHKLPAEIHHLLEIANTLFLGIEDFRSEESIKLIVNNYSAHKHEIKSFGPRAYQI